MPGTALSTWEASALPPSYCLTSVWGGCSGRTCNDAEDARAQFLGPVQQGIKELCSEHLWHNYWMTTRLLPKWQHGLLTPSAGPECLCPEESVDLASHLFETCLQNTKHLLCTQGMLLVWHKWERFVSVRFHSDPIPRWVGREWRMKEV